MGEIVEIRDRGNPPDDNLITARPWEFRRARWATPHFTQMLRSHSERLEAVHKTRLVRGEKGVAQLPSHYALKGGLASSIRAMYGFREDERRMRQTYHLAGLIDCMINQVNPVLRTDLLRDLYKKVFSMKEELRVNWYGPLDQVLFPIDPWLYNDLEYRSSMTRARTLKDLYEVIREGTEEMFDILSLEYVFYGPGPGG
jgi:hypothetical protein